MEFKGASAYDRVDFLSNYMEKRNRKDSPNNAIESHIIYELIGDFQGKNILDLGCGDATFGKDLLDKGAHSYTGIEGSKKMAFTATNNLSEVNGYIYNDTMEAYNYPNDKFDIVTARFSIHYVSEISVLLGNIYRTLRGKGKFVFSVQHPLTTSSFLSKKEGDKRENWIVDDYFIEGERKERWMGEVVIKYHRTIEEYFRAITKNDFSVIDLREGHPKREHFSCDKEFYRRKRIPIMLVFSCEKTTK